MSGYSEAITDPSYAGQILTFSYPLIGNYGFSPEWGESKMIHVSGIVVSQLSKESFHNQKELSLEEVLEKYQKGGISDIDTRELVKIIRTTGTMPAVLIVGKDGEYLQENLAFKQALERVHNSNDIGYTDWVNRVKPEKIKIYQSQILESKNSPERIEDITECQLEETQEKENQTIGLIDCGAKQNIIRELCKRQFRVVVFPAGTEFEKINEYDLDGFVLSNGPGDPRDYPYVHSTVQKILQSDKPVLGICLGHQLLAYTIGAEIFKMKFGNRGINQPVVNLLDGKAYLTSQNHSYAVKPETLPEDWEVLFRNLNDDSVEGLKHKSKPIFSVQFHPEACGGPRDTNFLFDDFAKLVKQRSTSKQSNY
jgi:carbamoyl-phosphate synthase small subunit